MQIYRQAPIRNRVPRKKSDVSISLDDIEYVEPYEDDQDCITLHAVDTSFTRDDRYPKFHVHLALEEVLYAFAMIPPGRIAEAAKLVFQKINENCNEETSPDHWKPRSTKEAVAGAMALIQAAIDCGDK